MCRMRKSKKQWSIKWLVIYMVTALLFLTSVELHVHTSDTAAMADHGNAVSTNILASDLMLETASDEITVEL